MSNKIWYVYQHTNLINGKSYIGITCQKPELRWGKDGKHYKQQSKFYNAILKYGWNNFKHEILFSKLTQEEALLKENELINQNNSVVEGYNSIYSSEENKIEPVICVELNQVFDNVSLAAAFVNVSSSSLSHHLNGDSLTCGGYTWTYYNNPDKQKRQEEKLLTKKQASLLRQKQLAIKEQQVIQDYHKTSNALITANNLGYSKSGVLDILHRTNTPTKHHKDIIMLTKEGNFIKEFTSCGAALKELGKDTRRTMEITECCRGKRKSAFGYCWKFKDDYEF